MKALLNLITGIHGLIAMLFCIAGLLLIGISIFICWQSVHAGFDIQAAQGIIEAIGLIGVAVVALQIAQTITEEEVIRKAHVSAPTRVRRYLSRFLVVIIVALAIEGLVATFKAVHQNAADLPRAASVLLAVAILLAGWGVFIKLNRAAEELEPEAMQQAKDEDEKLE